MPNFKVEPIDKQMVPLVNKFYKVNRGRARAKSSDKVWVMRERGELVAALRVVQLSGHEFLTGVQVALAKQGQGIATSLLTQVFEKLYGPDHSQQQEQVKVKPCYTFPYRHLVGFYERLGWQSIDSDDLPIPLQTRFARYVGQGRDICVMCYGHDQRSCP